jgi:hypothetical protein
MKSFDSVLRKPDHVGKAGRNFCFRNQNGIDSIKSSQVKLLATFYCTPCLLNKIRPGGRHKREKGDGERGEGRGEGRGESGEE